MIAFPMGELQGQAQLELYKNGIKNRNHDIASYLTLKPMFPGASQPHPF
jgi:hypothetical protein